MFQNYDVGVRNSVIDRTVEEVVNVSPSALTEVKDIYGNVIGLKWDSAERFTTSLTTDTIVPVFAGSKILKLPGEVPEGYGAIGMYAYNTADCRCWSYDGEEWVELDTIVSPASGKFVELFSNPNSASCVEFINFRGDVIQSLTSNSKDISFTHSDETSKIFPQGVYTANIYQVVNEENKLVRSLKIVVGKTETHTPGDTNIPQGVPPNEYISRDEYSEKMKYFESIISSSRVMFSVTEDGGLSLGHIKLTPAEEVLF